MDSITTPTLTNINGRQIRASSPLEVLACIRSSMLSREALSIAGRPGLPLMNSIATSVTDTAKIAGSQFGLRPSDGWLIGSIAEMKVNFQRLNEVAFVLSLGGKNLRRIGSSFRGILWWGRGGGNRQCSLSPPLYTCSSRFLSGDIPSPLSNRMHLKSGSSVGRQCEQSGDQSKQSFSFLHHPQYSIGACRRDVFL